MNANMTMCALDTRNDGRRDTNATVNVLSQFKGPILCFTSLTVFQLHVPYSGVTDFTVSPLTAGVCHVATTAGWIIFKGSVRQRRETISLHSPVGSSHANSLEILI